MHLVLGELVYESAERPRWDRKRRCVLGRMTIPLRWHQRYPIPDYLYDS